MVVVPGRFERANRPGASAHPSKALKETLSLILEIPRFPSLLSSCLVKPLAILVSVEQEVAWDRRTHFGCVGSTFPTRELLKSRSLVHRMKNSRSRCEFQSVDCDHFLPPRSGRTDTSPWVRSFRSLPWVTEHHKIRRPVKGGRSRSMARFGLSLWPDRAKL